MSPPTDIPVPSSDILAGLITGAGLSVPLPAVEKLVDHAREMLRWNRSIRLTAITDPAEVAVKHILDSLLLLRFAPFPGRILDFGSGAGYPGIPLAVVLPGSRFLLLESSGKKCAFLSHILRRLSLANAEVVQARLERNRRLPIGTFEHIVTRATLPPEAAVTVLRPYIAAAGRVLLMKGPGKGSKKSREKEGFFPPENAQERTVRFELPLRMGFREIREIRIP
ncbi:MAG: 16S rRNA (guanine(527)-N(7))-methyltransferase RsmG [Candidatus Deferrimicrobiaceae bacterium]